MFFSHSTQFRHGKQKTSEGALLRVQHFKYQSLQHNLFALCIKQRNNLYWTKNGNCSAWIDLNVRENARVLKEKCAKMPEVDYLDRLLSGLTGLAGKTRILV